MSIGRVATALLVLVLAASGGCGSEPATPAWRFSYHLEGGLAGFDVRFTLAADAPARYERRRPDARQAQGRIADAELGPLLALLRSPSFAGLDSAYETREGPVADGFRYTFTWEEGGRKRSVTAADGVILPEVLIQIREQVGRLQRLLLREEERHVPSTPGVER